jgi:hypothetical protein
MVGGRVPLNSGQRQHQETLAKLVGEDPFEYDTPIHRRAPLGVQQQVLPHSILVEDDYVDDLPPPAFSSSSESNPPASRLGAARPSLRSQKISGLSSVSSITSRTDTERVPLFLHEEGQKSPYAQDTFPQTITPSGTPPRGASDAREPKDDDDMTEEQVVYFNEELKGRRAVIARMEREVDPKLSWVGDNSGTFSYSELF